VLRPHPTILGRVDRWAHVFGHALPPRSRRFARQVIDRVRSQARAVKPHAEPQVVDSLDAWQEYERLTRDLIRVLNDAGVDVSTPWLAGERPLAGRQSVLIPASQAEAAAEALRTSPISTHCWVSTRSGQVRLSEAANRLTERGALVAFQAFAAPSGTLLCGDDLTVGLRLVEEPDPVATSLRHAQLPHLMRIQEPIDVVYTWVDDSDPVWRSERAAVHPGEKLAADALSPSRTADRGELRYSLRSLAMYAGWVRHVWIITSGQVPEWLDVDHPKVSVLPHSAIFAEPEALPTFNSHAIESQLHHIPGLAEHFIYLNDDVFFGRPVSADLFFHGNGIAKFMTSNVAIDRDPDEPARNGAMMAARNNRRHIDALWGRSPTHRMQHVPHAHRRSSLADLETRLRAEFSAVSHARFRSVQDISVASDLGHYHAFQQGLAAPGSLAFRYIDIASAYADEYFEHLLAARDVDTFCVNDVCADSPTDDVTRVIDFLERYFPLPSPFERAA